MNFTPHNQPNPSILRNPDGHGRACFVKSPLPLLALLFPLIFAATANCQDQSADSTAAPVGEEAAEQAAKQADQGAAKKKSDGFSPLREHWEKCVFGGDGEIKIRGESTGGVQIEMMPGDPITGVRWTGDFPKENYELRLQARRVDGFDFFAAVTFPVGEEHCSFVLGGWGGGMVGISSIDGMDASSNETTQYKEFETGHWYTVRIRVDNQNVRCWIDGHEYAVVERGEHTLSIRIEMDPCLPMGIASFMTRSELKNIELKRINAATTPPTEAETNE